MRFYKILYLLGLSVGLLNSCIKDDTFIPDEADGDKVRLEFYTNASEYRLPTRAEANETGVTDTPMVLVFTGNDGTAMFAECVLSYYDTDTGKTTVTLTRRNTDCIIMVIANAPDGKFTDGVNTYAFTDHNIRDVLAGKTLSESESLLMTDKIGTTAPVNVPFINPKQTLPMSGTIKVAKIDIDTQIGPADNKMYLLRTVAKATVNVASSATNFTLAGVGAINVPRNGSFYRDGATLPSNSGNLTNYLRSATGDGVTGVVDIASDGKSSSPLYIYETAKETKPALIVKGTYLGTAYYYKLEFHDNGQHLSIERNNHYTFNITAISAGYPTMQEAIDGTPYGLIYELTVDESRSYDIVDDGEFYLGVGASNVLIYENNDVAYLAQSGVLVTTNAWVGGPVTSSLTSSTGITVNGPTNGQLNLAPSQGLTGDTNITFTMEAGVTSGTITIKVGNLTKTVNITRRARMSYGGFDELPWSDCVACRVFILGTGTRWLQLSLDGSTPITTGFDLTTPSKVYLLAASNIGNSPVTPREGGQFDITRTNSGAVQGSTKVFVTQDAFDLGEVEQEYPEDPNYFYVGAFWKYWQTGERLIHIQHSDEKIGKWSAVVTSGEDWIKLDTQKTSDPGVTWNAATENPADMNTVANDALYQVSGNATSISGEVKAGDTGTYFRIGLKSAYTRTPEAPARYGTVVFFYNNNTKYNIIYIRQGETPDYVMRPTDPSADGDTWGTAPNVRPLARKWGVYNLTSPNFLNNSQPGGAILTDHAQIFGREGTFTEYPTQAGAYFQWANPAIHESYSYAFHPTNPVTGFTGWVPFSGTLSYWNSHMTMYETCPAGYRRPNNGSTTGAELTSLTAISEMRQSLWQSPWGGGSNNNLDTQTWGFYADGFFDRRQIVASPSGTPYSAVAVNSTRIAYAGSLMYNPNNNASLFLPMAGYRDEDEGYLFNTGVVGYYWSSSAYNMSYPPVAGSMIMRPYYSYAHPQLQARGAGSTIRCVVDE